ncbi:unnamed protein product [Phytophthora lilii]|uniref:Unnamed protein product n=1 Tax=Phytophthora lilii TaxID=2077276 RepID=A0A9W6WNS6_9STRA|nr:unnamed protein product [Phytophthora lilii]
MDKRRPKHSAGRRAAPAVQSEPTFQRQGSWKQRSSSVLWLKLNFTIKAARLQTLKRQKYQHLQEEALLKARGLLKNWEDGPVLLTEDLYSRARSEHDAQELLNYTPEALALRFSLRNHPDVVEAVKQLWSVELPRDELGCIDQRGYASLFRRIGRSLEPDATKQRLRRMEKTIQEDWVRDSKGEPVMSFANFFDSVFELADLWCETIDVDEYIAFLQRLVLRVSSVRRTKHDPSSVERRLLRPLKQIKAIDNDDESSSSEEEEEVYQSDVDDEAELSSDDDEEDEDDMPVQLPPPVTPTHSMGFIATKALQTLRAPPSSAGPTQEVNSTPEPVPEDRPRTRERRASIITLGDFGLGGLGGFGGFPVDRSSESDPKTPTGLRGSSAKSRTASAKEGKPLSSLRENGAANSEDDEGVNALVAMHRLRSAQTRTPVIVEDTAVNNTIPSNRVALNVGLPNGNFPQPRQQRPPKLFTAAFGAPTAGVNVGSVNMEGLPASGGLQSTLTSSTPHLPTTGGLKSGFGNIDSARVGSGGARRSLLSSSPKAKQRGEKKPAGIVFDGPAQQKGNNKRLAALGVNSTGGANTAYTSKSSNQDGTGKKTGIAGSAIDEEQFVPLSNNAESAVNVPREYVSGFGFETPTPENKETGNSTIRKKTDILPVNPSLPFYTFDESASPAKRLLPPVLIETGGRGRSGARSGKTRRQGSAGHRAAAGPDFSGSYKTTGYLTGSLQAQILAHTRWSVLSARNTDARSLQQGATPLWFPLPGKEARSHTRRSTSKLSLKKARKHSPDDGYSDVTVSPWDTEFDREPEDDDLARAVPRSDQHRGDHQRITPRESVLVIPVATVPVSPTASPDSSKLPLATQDDLNPELTATELPTLSVSSSMVPPEPPSCVSELTTLPQEYHELILGGSALNSYKGLSRTESAPVGTTSPIPVQAAPITHAVKILSREPQWMLQGASKPPLTLLEDGVEGRTLTGSSPRPVLTALTSKRPRRERDTDDEEEAGLCPRFVEHLESHGDRAATAHSPLFRTDKPKSRCTCSAFVEGDAYDKLVESDDRVNPRCPCHGSSNNNHQDELAADEEECFPLEQDVEACSMIEDITVIVNATRGLVLRPGTMDRLAAKRARYKQQATRSEMMRRRCQYTFAKHLG